MISAFLAGFCCATFAAAGVFFFKFYKASRDSFYLWFTMACWLLAIERIAGLVFDGVLHIIQPGTEAASYIYLIRLAAFAAILIAIIKRNIHNSPPRSPKV